MIYVRCQDVVNKKCRFIATSNNKNELIDELLNHIKKEHPFALKDMNYKKLSELKGKIKEISKV
jgi:predicted small metal-binding protein